MNKVLVLRQCNKDLKSYGGFQHPSSGHVSAPDWNPKPKCGSGLHGFLYGEGDGSLANYDPENKWLVLSVDKDKIVDLSGKVKFPEGEVIFCGALAEAARYVYDNGGAGRAIIGITVTGGDGSTVSGGNRSTVTGGEKALITLQYWDSKTNRVRQVIAYVGENGIEAGKAYKLDKNHQFVLA